MTPLCGDTSTKTDLSNWADIGWHKVKREVKRLRGRIFAAKSKKELSRKVTNLAIKRSKDAEPKKGLTSMDKNLETEGVFGSTISIEEKEMIDEIFKSASEVETNIPEEKEN
jgi:hypothetical protein